MSSEERRRVECAWHEAGHATASWLYGLEFEVVELIPEDEQADQGAAGRVRFEGGPPLRLEGAIDHMTVSLIGDPTYRLAWASGMIAHPPASVFIDAPIEALLALPNGSSSQEAREATLGMIQADDQPDADQARWFGEMFTTAPDETEHLLKFARARAAALASTERFMAIAGALANVLLPISTLSGPDAVAVMERAARLFDIRTQTAELFRDEE